MLVTVLSLSGFWPWVRLVSIAYWFFIIECVHWVCSLSDPSVLLVAHQCRVQADNSQTTAIRSDNLIGSTKLPDSKYNWTALPWSGVTCHILTSNNVWMIFEMLCHHPFCMKVLGLKFFRLGAVGFNSLMLGLQEWPFFLAVSLTKTRHLPERVSWWWTLIEHLLKSRFNVIKISILPPIRRICQMNFSYWTWPVWCIRQHLEQSYHPA